MAKAKDMAMRERLQAAAHKLYLKRGQERVSVDQISRTANASVGTVYNHFESKDDLTISLLVPGDMLPGERRNRLTLVEWDALLRLVASGREAVSTETLENARRFVALHSHLIDFASLALAACQRGGAKWDLTE